MVVPSTLELTSCWCDGRAAISGRRMRFSQDVYRRVSFRETLFLGDSTASDGEEATTILTGLASGFASQRTAAPHADPGEGVTRARTHPLDPSRAHAARTRSRPRTATRFGVDGHSCCFGKRTHSRGACDPPNRVTRVASRRLPGWFQPARLLARARVDAVSRVPSSSVPPPRRLRAGPRGVDPPI